jgi:hypothetical protein
VYGSIAITGIACRVEFNSFERLMNIASFFSSGLGPASLRGVPK